MKTFLRTAVALLLLTGWGLSAAALHVVRGPDRVAIIPKNRLGFADTYVDVRDWTPQDVAAHPALADRLLRAGKSGFVAHAFDPADAADLRRQIADAVAAGRRAVADAANDAADAALQEIEAAK